jgi:signal transduction histidine kinase
MPEGPAAPFPFEALTDGVAQVDADGSLRPQNDAMRALLAAWSPDADQLLQLVAGERLQVVAAGREHELCCVAHGDRRWLVARAIDGAERAAAAEFAAARVRQLGDLAASIAHDLNNLLGSAMGLASVLEASTTDAAERRLIGELQRGAARGATMTRGLARMLKVGPRQRVVVAAADLVDEVLALGHRSASQHQAEFTVRAAADLPGIRVVAAEATQALLHGIVALIEAGGRRIAVEADAIDVAVAGGRERRCLRVRVSAACPPPPATSTPAAWQAMATLALRRMGGDFVAAVDAGGCRFDYVWPAVATD